MRKAFLFLVPFLILAVSCSDRDDDLAAVNIRIKNSSSRIFDRVLVESEEHVYEDVGSDSFSEYQEYELAYRYNYIEITSGEESFVLQPVDFVGEEELPTGLYTYVLDISEEGEVILEFVID